EIHSPDQPRRYANPGEELEAPGILRNAVPVEALYDWRAAEGVTLRNLLQRQGYADLDAVLAAGEAEGQAKGEAEGRLLALVESVLGVLDARDLDTSDAQRRRIVDCADPDQLGAWLRAAAVADSAAALFSEE
ncbi:MAG: Uma2 family endonuclease, partial [Acidobacteriota bacterium]